MRAPSLSHDQEETHMTAMDRDGGVDDEHMRDGNCDNDGDGDSNYVNEKIDASKPFFDDCKFEAITICLSLLRLFDESDAFFARLSHINSVGSGLHCIQQADSITGRVESEKPRPT